MKLLKRLKESLFSFFLHIQINTLNTPYQTLPSPYQANLLSKIVRKVVDTPWLRGLVGLNLVAAMAIVPFDLDFHPSQQNSPLNKIQVTDGYFSTDNLDPVINSDQKAFVVPVSHLRFIGQGFHSGHTAYDLNASIGTDVLSFSKGKVILLEAGYLGYGHHIIIDHDHGLYSLYAHLQSFAVKLGDEVEVGQKIGEIGMTGWTTGPHLHFEIIDNGKAINPSTYLDFSLQK